nr:unnamed protein product [Digitaria exilis]
MMLAGELDFHGAVPDSMGDPDVGVAMLRLVVPAEAEQGRPSEQQGLDEQGERPRAGAEPAGRKDAAAAADARLADVEAARGGRDP